MCTSSVVNEKGLAVVMNTGNQLAECEQLPEVTPVLYELNGQVATILEHISDAFLALDSCWHMLYINKEAEKFLRQPREALLGKKLWEAFPEAANIPLDMQFRLAIADGKLAECELFCQSLQTWVELRANPSQDGLFVFFRDITERKCMEELRENERRKDDFISMASHELRNPLTSLKATNQLLQRQLEKEGRDELVCYLERMDRQINRLTKLISDLLDVTKIASGNIDLVKEPFNLDLWLKGMIDDLQQGNGHIITCTGSSGREIVADRDRLGQVMTNLISNAVKYSPQAQKVEVGVAQQQENVLISIRDYGIGIPQHLQEKIFERFFRVGADRKISGLGMGLYIASEIVKLHGGKLWVESVEGEGSTFSFSLPLL